MAPLCRRAVPVVARMLQGSRRCFARGTSGQGWYQKFEKEGEESFQRYQPPTPFDWGVAGSTAKASLEISIDGNVEGQIEVELLEDLLPITVKNFLDLVTGDNPHNFTYTGTHVYRVVKGAAIVLGDVEHKDGQASHSAYPERYFADEALIMPHSQAGILSMVNGGVDTNGSQFYITTAPAPHLDGYSVAFGRVTNGMEIVHKISGLYSIRGRPVNPVVVSDASVLSE